MVATKRGLRDGRVMPIAEREGIIGRDSRGGAIEKSLICQHFRFCSRV